MTKLINLSGAGIIALFLLSTFTCFAQHDQNDKSKTTGSNTGQYGETFDEMGALDVASVLLKEPGESEAVKVTGKIKEVCQEMGCWITLELPDNKTIRVSTEEKFFLPNDISGRIAIVQGTLKKQVTSVDQLRHFAQDAGKDKDYINSITEPREEYSIIATGVKVLPESK